MSRYIIRPIKKSDHKDLIALSKAAGLGFTSLPPNPEFLDDKINDSLLAFDDKIRRPGGESYLFALEDTQEKKVIGTSGIISKVGGFEPFFTYKIKKEIYTSNELKTKKEIPVLHLETNHNGPSEICSLILDPSYRKAGLGRLLSLCRFLFISCFKERFDKTIISELRGVIDKNATSPFWQCVGKHFFGVDFFTADAFSGLGNKKFIADLMPKHPIFIPLLPNSVQAVIGEVHKDTRPARALLEKEGFEYNYEVDIFDAGPTVSTTIENIRTIKHSKTSKFKAKDNISSNTDYMVSNRDLDFRCLVTKLDINEDGSVFISNEVIKSLNLKENQEITYVSLR